MNLDSDEPLERDDERKRPAFSGYFRVVREGRWQKDRDDSLVYSDFTPLDDPEPLQRDLFK